MKICVVTHTFPRYKGDPVAPFMDDFCEGLVRAGNEVAVVTPFDCKFKIKDYQQFKIKLFRYIYPDSLHLLGYSRTLEGDQKMKWFVYFQAPLMFAAELIALIKVVRAEQIDIISAHWIVPNGFIAAIAGLITRKPVVITIPGSDMYLAKKSRLIRAMAKYAVNHSALILSNSTCYLNEFAKFGLRLPRAKEVVYGIDTDKYRLIKVNKKALRKKFGISSKECVVLSVGRAVEKKGLRYLIEAMPKVLAKKKNTSLLIVGGGDQLGSLKGLARKLKLEKKVVFAGKVSYSALAQIYAIADVYVAPSVEDSQGNLESHTVALFEAIASGVPIVATKLAVSSEFVVDGKNGYRVSQRSSAALAEKIVVVLNSNLSQMANNSRKIAKEKLSHLLVGEQYTKILKQFV